MNVTGSVTETNGFLACSAMASKASCESFESASLENNAMGVEGTIHIGRFKEMKDRLNPRRFAPMGAIILRRIPMRSAGAPNIGRCYIY